MTGGRGAPCRWMSRSTFTPGRCRRSSSQTTGRDAPAVSSMPCIGSSTCFAAAERHRNLLRPRLGRRAAACTGACHRRRPATSSPVMAMAHAKVSEQSRDAFRDDVHRARECLRILVGYAVLGYRAPSFSIGAEQWWAFSILAEAGYRYSSSLNPSVTIITACPRRPGTRSPHRGGPGRGAGRHRRCWLAHALRRRRLF